MTVTGTLPEFQFEPRLKNPALIVGWSVDTGNFGRRVTDRLINGLGCRTLCEMQPVGYFGLGRVPVVDSVIRFPESVFYACEEKNLLIFRSVPPGMEWYSFLNQVLSIAERFGVSQMYTLGAMVNSGAHTMPRQLMAIFGSQDERDSSEDFALGANWDYETPPGQRPTINSYLLWLAHRRNIRCVGLWVPIPFYLLGVGDPRSDRRMLGFLDERLALNMDLKGLDDEARRQSNRIADARRDSPELEDYIRKLETNLLLDGEESQKLVDEIERLLETTD
jgi:proteasome assembly chaperone (PAC2) family protein